MSYETLKPVAAGDLTEIESQTPDSGEHWDKLLTKDGDTTKVHTINATWQNDLYLFDFTGLQSGMERCPIDYVRVYIYSRFIAPCPPWPEEPRIEGIFKTYGIVYPSGNWIQPMASYTDIGKSSTTNPHTGEAWTWSELSDENFQIGIRMHCDGIYEVACSALQIRLYYTPVAPLVTTQAVTEIAGTTATGNGTVVDFGGDFVYEHGHCWSTSPNPTISDSKTENGIKWDPGAFTSSITGLIPGTKYYVRAYALNYVETSYGDEVEFTALAPLVAPTVTTNPATSVGQTTATKNGTLDDDGGEDCSVRFEYGETTDYGFTTSWQSGKSTGNTFSQEVRGLNPSRVYHFRAVASNSAGTSYGDDRTLRTSELSADAHQAQGRHFSMGRHGL